MAMKPEQIVVVMGVTSSEQSEYAFKWYVKHLHRPNHLVHFVSVQVDKPKSTQRRRESWDYAKKVGENYLSWAEQNRVQDIKFASPQGESEWQEIIKYAESVGAHMIITGCRGQTVNQKTLTSSVCDAVLKHSPIPVLVCRAKSD